MDINSKDDLFPLQDSTDDIGKKLKQWEASHNSQILPAPRVEDTLPTGKSKNSFLTNQNGTDDVVGKKNEQWEASHNTQNIPAIEGKTEQLPQASSTCRVSGSSWSTGRYAIQFLVMDANNKPCGGGTDYELHYPKEHMDKKENRPDAGEQIIENGNTRKKSYGGMYYTLYAPELGDCFGRNPRQGQLNSDGTTEIFRTNEKVEVFLYIGHRAMAEQGMPEITAADFPQKNHNKGNTSPGIIDEEAPLGSAMTEILPDKYVEAETKDIKLTPIVVHTKRRWKPWNYPLEKKKSDENHPHDKYFESVMRAEKRSDHFVRRGYPDDSSTYTVGYGHAEKYSSKTFAYYEKNYGVIKQALCQVHNKKTKTAKQIYKDECILPDKTITAGEYRGNMSDDAAQDLLEKDIIACGQLDWINVGKGAKYPAINVPLHDYELYAILDMNYNSGTGLWFHAGASNTEDHALLDSPPSVADWLNRGRYSEAAKIVPERGNTASPDKKREWNAGVTNRRLLSQGIFTQKYGDTDKTYDPDSYRNYSSRKKR